MPIREVVKDEYTSITQNDLLEFLHNHQISLPSEYRDFLLKYNGGHPEPSFFWTIIGNEGSEIYQFFGLNKKNKYRSIEFY